MDGFEWHRIDLSNKSRGENTLEEDTLNFKKHLATTKYWFSCISSGNKKRFLIALVKDIRSASALSFLLKSIWNCRPKDAVLSTSGTSTWSRYDQAPMDHNRTALPLATLAKAVKSDREWFQTLEPETQSRFLLELLSIAGGPIMWAVLQRAQTIYDKYRNDQLRKIENSITIVEKFSTPEPEAAVPSMLLKAKSQKSLSSRRTTISKLTRSASVTNVRIKSVQVPAKIQLQHLLLEWNSVIKSMKASFKLEEIETTFKDGSKNRIWKVNRTSPEGTETVDFVQLLPGVVAKRILSYLPQTQLASCAYVNKYWAYLVDDLKQEKNARRQLEIDIIKLEHYVNPLKINPFKIPSQSSYRRISKSSTTKIPHRADIDPVLPSCPHSSPTSTLKEKSSISSSSSSTIIKNVRKERKSNNPPYVAVGKKGSLPPIRNMAAMSEGLNRRGTLDDNLWKWCEAALKRDTVNNQTILPALKQGVRGVTAYDTYFPGPLMAETKQAVDHSQLASAPVTSATLNAEHDSSGPVTDSTSKRSHRVSLWSNDFSRLYPAFKIASYQSPM